MNALDALVHEVLTHPDDDVPRLKAAAEWDRLGDPRGELVRVQCELALRDDSRAGWERRWEELSARQDALLGQHAANWAAPFKGLVSGFSFVRGFVEHVALPAPELIAKAGQIFALAPIRHLDLTAARDVVRPLFALPQLGQIVSLSLAGCRIGDAGLRVLAESPHLGRLEWLDLGGNEITAQGVEALAASPKLPRLTRLFMPDNPADPVETAIRDEVGTVATIEPSELGLTLEAKHGKRPWLHVQDFSRFGPRRF